MPAMNAVALPAAPILPGGGAGPAGAVQGVAAAFEPALWEAPTKDEGEGVGIGIDLGCEWVRVAVWNAEEGRSEEISCGGDDEMAMRCSARIAGSKVEAPCAMNAMEGGSSTVPLVGVQRVLGRKFGSLSGARFLEAESDELIGCTLEPSDGLGAGVGSPARLKVVVQRPKGSGLKKRGASAGSSKGTEPKPTIERTFAPEEVVYKLLVAAKARAEAACEAEVTHGVICVPSHWGAAQRQAAYDCAVLANLTPLAVLSHSAALLSLPPRRPASTRKGSSATTTAARGADSVKGGSTVLVDWGAGGCSLSVMRDGELVACVGDDGVGGLVLDRRIGRRLADQLAGQPAVATVDCSTDANRLVLLQAARSIKHRLFDGEPVEAYAAERTVSVTVALSRAVGVGASGGGGTEGDASGGGSAGTCEVSVQMSAAEWHAAVSDALEAVETMLQKVIQQAQIPPTERIRVVVSGGTSRCPHVPTRAHDAHDAHYAHVRAHMPTCVHARSGAHTCPRCTHAHMHTCARVHTCTHAHMHTCARAYMCVQVSTRARTMLTCTHACTHAHVRTCASRCPLVRTMLLRALGDPSTYTIAWAEDEAGCASAAARGAATIAAHQLQPSAVQAALGSGWQPVVDALPVAVHVQEAGGEARQILPPMSRAGASLQLSFAASSQELTVQLAEALPKPKAGYGANRGAGAASSDIALSPLLDALVPSSTWRGRSLLDVLLGRRKHEGPPPQRTVDVMFSAAGVVEVECDGGDDGLDGDGGGSAGGRLSLGSLLLLLMVLVSSLVAMVPPPTPPPSAAATARQEQQTAQGSV